MGLVSLLLTALLLIPLSSSFLRLLDQARRDAAAQLVERAIATSLKRETISLGREAEVVGVSIDWTQNPPLIRASARVTNPRLPTPKQVAAIQDYINSKQPINFRLVVQRLSTDVVGPETDPNPPQVQEKLRGGRITPKPALPEAPEPGAQPGAEVAPPVQAKPPAAADNPPDDPAKGPGQPDAAGSATTP